MSDFCPVSKIFKKISWHCFIIQEQASGQTESLQEALTTASGNKKHGMKIKYRLSDPKKVRALVLEYGKTSLTKSADNLADVFLSLK